MTQQQHIEIIQRQFPEVGEKELRIRLNDINTRFIRESRIIQDVATTTSIADQVEYNFSDFTTAGSGELLEVYDIEVPDISEDNFVWYPERNRSTIVIGKETTNSSDNVVVSAIASGKTIYAYGVYGDPGYSTTLTEEPAYDSEFHMAPVYGILSDLHLEGGDAKMSAEWYRKYKDLEVAAKKAANARGIKGNYRSFRSNDESPRRIG